MKNILIFNLLLAALFFPAFGQEVQVLKGQPVFIEFHAKDAGDAPTLLVTERQTGKKALVVLKRQPGHTDIWYSFLVIRLGDDLPGPQLLQFQTRDGKDLFPHAFQTKKGNFESMAVTLFTDSQEQQNFSKEFEQSRKEEDLKNVSDLQKSAKTKADAQLGAEAMEALKRERLLQEQEKLSSADRKKKKAEAAAAAKQATALYEKGQYKKAEVFYSKAKDLDPENDSFYFQHGVCLYKIGKYNQSLSVLSLAEGGNFNKAEYDYYIALNHMKLKEYERALEEFKELRDENDPNLSPVASFFAGSIEFQYQKYPEAKSSFEYTMDNSKDPKLDKEAEKMVEEIDRIETFLATSKEILSYTFNLGLSYDGNVLNVPKQNQTTDTAGYRSSYGVNLLFRLLHSMSQELSLQALYNDMYSVDTNLAANASLQSADAQMTQASLPYKTNFAVGKKAFGVNLTPSYSVLTMDAVGTGRAPILRSSQIAGDISTAFTQDWLGTFKLEYVKEESLLEVVTPESDSSGNRTTVGTTQTKLLGLDGKQSLSLDLSYANNVADGQDINYNQTIVGLTYGFPSFWSSSGSLRVDYSTKVYPTALTARDDKATNLTFSQLHDLAKKFSLSWSLQYNQNESTIATYQYDKIVAAIGLTYTGAFSRE